jgi:hypothetical protein
LRQAAQLVKQSRLDLGMATDGPHHVGQCVGGGVAAGDNVRLGVGADFVPRQPLLVLCAEDVCEERLLDAGGVGQQQVLVQLEGVVGVSGELLGCLVGALEEGQLEEGGEGDKGRGDAAEGGDDAGVFEFADVIVFLSPSVLGGTRGTRD